MISFVDFKVFLTASRMSIQMALPAISFIFLCGLVSELHAEERGCCQIAKTQGVCKWTTWHWECNQVTPSIIYETTCVDIPGPTGHPARECVQNDQGFANGMCDKLANHDGRSPCRYRPPPKFYPGKKCSLRAPEDVSFNQDPVSGQITIVQGECQ